MDTLFATETMAELSARQGRVADAIAIYRHLVGGAATAPANAPDDAARVARWQARIAELEAGGAAAVAPTSPPRTRDQASPSADRSDVAPAPASERNAQSASLVVDQPVRRGAVLAHAARVVTPRTECMGH